MASVRWRRCVLGVNRRDNIRQQRFDVLLRGRLRLAVLNLLTREWLVLLLHNHVLWLHHDILRRHHHLNGLLLLVVVVLGTMLRMHIRQHRGRVVVVVGHSARVGHEHNRWLLWARLPSCARLRRPHANLQMIGTTMHACTSSQVTLHGCTPTTGFTSESATASTSTSLLLRQQSGHASHDE